MSEENNKNQNEKQPRRFNQQQYDMLKRCSDKKDMTEWNEWRVNNPEKDVLLEGAELDESYLEDAFLTKGMVKWDSKIYEFTGEVYLENACLRQAHLKNACLQSVHLENARLWGAHLENVYLTGTHLENACLRQAHLGNADFTCAHLENANLVHAHLENANLVHAHLENANLLWTHLENANFTCAHLENACLNDSSIKGARFRDAYLQNTEFRRAVVDGETLVWACSVDKHTTQKNNGTDFSGVGLESIRIDPDTKQLLQYNIRRMNWEGWYTGESRGIKNKWIQFLRKIITHSIRWFWAMSDYGLSTGRIIITFLVLMIAFACVYYVWGMIAPPGIVDYLFVDKDGVEVTRWLVLIRAIHFSVVIMTVGFTNMHANAHSFWAHILVGLQMILGFVLLGALITRFAVLFTAGGPAGKFADENKKDADDKVS